MDIDNQLNKLKRIGRVDPPYFLLTKIKNRILRSQDDAPVQWRWLFAMTAIIILVLNIALLAKTTVTTQDARLQEVTAMMHLSSSNGLYDN